LIVAQLHRAKRFYLAQGLLLKANLGLMLPKTYRSNRGILRARSHIDYLVFSSHRTSTQSMANSLRSSGALVKHCHELRHIGLKKGELLPDINRAFEVTGRKLRIVSVYREPIERHMSSFFQIYGERAYDIGHIANTSDSILYKQTVPELRRGFIRHLREGSLAGYNESICLLLSELGLEARDLKIDSNQGYGYWEGGTYTLRLYEFSSFVKNMDEQLAALIDRPLEISKRNSAESAWYRDIYKEFKKDIKLPEDVIYSAYENCRNAVEIFSEGGFDSALKRALDKYA